MNRVSKYTVLCLLLAAVFVLGSIAGMDFILQMRERQRLEESGTVEVESPVLAWQAQAAEEGGAGQDGTDTRPDGEEDRLLTEEQMADVIRYRNDCEGEFLHDPAKGQITMEQAIASGENWLVEMGFAEEIEEIADGNEDSIRAKRVVSGKTEPAVLLSRVSLGTKTPENGLQIPVASYFSFWTVRFSNKYMYVSLSVNAVTGKVWDAEITLYGNTAYSQSIEKLELFIKLAGVQTQTEDYIETDGKWQSMAVKESPLYGRMRHYDVMAVSKGAEEYVGNQELYIETVIEYHLMADEDYPEDKSVNSDEIYLFDTT